jgi:type IX secretion system PorP/SprF family membrane protein
MKFKYISGSLLLILTLLTGNILKAQQLPQFSQYIFNGLHINPGYAGYKNVGYIQSTYRSQWMNFPGAPKTMSITADLSANEGRMGFGISYLRDGLGLTESNLGLLTYAYRIRTGYTGNLSLGLSGGFSEYALDPSRVSTIMPDDPNIPVSRISAIAPNMNTGLFYHDDRIFAGISAYNLIGQKALYKQDIAVGFHDIHYYLTFGGMFSLTDDLELKPSVLIKHVKGSPTNFDINSMLLIREKVWVGGSWRSNVRVFEDQLQENLKNRNAIALLLEYFVNSGLRLGYSYDYNLNVLNNKRNQSHELSVGVYLKSKREVIYSPRWF